MYSRAGMRKETLWQVDTNNITKIGKQQQQQQQSNP